MSMALLPASASAASRRLSPSPQTFDYGPARLDTYARAGASSLPVVLFIHGGAWRAGNRTNVDVKPGFLLDKKEMGQTVKVSLFAKHALAA